MSRWIELSQYDMVVVHRPGKYHVNADTLSQIPDTLKYCENYNNDMKITELPCYPCRYCACAQKLWAKFTEEVDYFVSTECPSNSTLYRCFVYGPELGY